MTVERQVVAGTEIPTVHRPLPPVRPGFSDHIYRTVHNVDLPLRIWPAEGNGRHAPWVLWLHGGSFAGGKWSAPTAWVPRAFTERGYVVVSVGYRFLPDVGLPEILEDCAAAHEWCLRELPSILKDTPAGVDLSSCVVAGASAGGTAAALCGFKLSPAPKAIVNVYGMVDVFDPVHHNPLPFDVDPPVTDHTEAEFEAALHAPNPSKALTQAPWISDVPPAVSLDETRAHLGIPDYTSTEDTYFRIDLVNYMVKRRIMLRLLLHAETLPQDEFNKRMSLHDPLSLLDSVESYPPTFMLHGTGDRYVPVHQARKMAAKLKSMGVEVGEVYPEGREHCFDWVIETPQDPGWDDFIVPILDFVDRHAKSTSTTDNSSRWCSLM